MINLSPLCQKIVDILRISHDRSLRQSDSEGVVKWADEISRRYSLYKIHMDFDSASQLATREVLEYLIREELDRYLVGLPREIEAAHDDLDSLPGAPPRSVYEADKEFRLTLSGRLERLSKNAKITRNEEA